MASTYSSNLKIELIGTGEQTGTWGTTTNSNFSNVFEQSIVGRVTVNFATDANKTLSASDSVSSQDFRNVYLNLTSSGSLTATRDLIVPTINKNYIIQNNTTGSQSIRVITAAGTGITVPTGATCAVYVDGTNVIQAFDYLPVINIGTIDLTNLEVTNIKAKDGTASMTLADSTGVVTFSANPIYSSGTANGVLYLNGSKSATSGSSFVFDGTNVGIGTSSPSTKLDVQGTNTYIRVKDTSTGVAVFNASNDSGNFYIGADNSSGSGFGSGAYSRVIYSAGAYPLVFSTNGTERMRLDSSGNLLLGATAQYNGGKFEMAGTSSDFVSTRFVNAAGGANIYLQHSRGASVGTNTIVQAGDTLGTIIFSGANGTTFSDAAYIQAQVDNTPGASADMPGRLLFFTSADGSATPTERMRLDSSGNLGLGVTPSAWATFKAAQVNYGALASTAGNNTTVTSNAIYDGAWKYVAASTATSYNQDSGTHYWRTAGSGSAGGTITWTQTMTLDASGNLGIGTINPSSKLDVKNGAVTAGATAIVLNGRYDDSYPTSGAGYFQLRTNNVDTTSGGLSVYTNNAGTLRLSYIVAETGSGSSYHAWNTNGSERMRIDTNGYVMIGTTTTDQKFNLYGGNMRISNSTTGTSSGIVFGMNSADAFLSNQANGYLLFGTNNTERMRIDATGNVLFAQAVRATITTDNDLSFDMNVASNFKCTPSAGGALTFTNITSGQTGNIILVNGSNYAITAAATTKVSSTCLATISATGTYWLSYYSDGTSVYVANTGALA